MEKIQFSFFVLLEFSLKENFYKENETKIIKNSREIKTIEKNKIK